MKKKNKKAPVYRSVRVLLAATFLVAMTLTFLHIEPLFDKWLWNLPKLEFWPAVLAGNAIVLSALVLLTVLFGRVYCSVLCPLGICQDAAYKLSTLGSRKRSHRFKWAKAPNAVRYGILAVFIVLVAVGLEAFAYMLEPYSIFGRAVTSLGAKSLTIAAISAVTMLLVMALAFYKGRLWCNAICPVGSILGLLSRWSIFRPSIDESACIGCGSCAKACRSNCIDPVNHTVDMSRCVLCFDCMNDCSVAAIDYKPVLNFRGNNSNDTSKAATPKAAPEADSKDAAASQSEDKNMGRRAFLVAGALAVGSAAKTMAEGQGALAVLKPKQTPVRRTPVVPAGALSLKNFDTKCVACQLCVTACPNQVLRPDTTGSAAMFMQPVMGFDKGFCRPECNLCTTACPTGAITPISVEQKASTSIGHAVVDLRMCVVNTDDVKCGNCARHCPAGAIRMVALKAADGSDTGKKVPAVITERCIGCGRCEYVCPSRPVSAITVEGNEVHHNI